jgi:hypothetical protein
MKKSTQQTIEPWSVSMTPELVFRIGSQIAGIGWLTLIFAGKFRFVPTILCKFLIPGSIAILYSALILTHWAGHPGGFGSLTAVQQLFTDPWIVAAGWLHYLAFDLFLGAWQVRESQRFGIGHLWVVPCLVATFLFGPMGYLSFLLLRLIRSEVNQHEK